jgi:glycosyltransferase involved in cell wall biosynthesis
VTPHVVIDAMSCEVGGGLTYLLSQLTALTETRPDLELTLLVSPKNFAAFRSSLDLEIIVIPLRSPATRFLYEQSLMPRRSRGTLLYCPGNFIPLFSRGVPTILTLQNPNYFGAERPASSTDRVKRYFSHASAKRADAVIAISRTLLDAMQSDGIHAHRVELIYSGRGVWDALPQKPTLAPTSGFVLSLANDYPHKNLSDTVASWALTNSKAPVTRLVLAGTVTSVRQSQLLRMVPPAARDNVHFLGAVTARSEVRWLLEHASMMVSSSTREAFPLTPSEAGSVGCPLILSDIPAHREVATGNAYYAPPHDIFTFARQIQDASRRGSRHFWKWPVTWEDNALALGQLFDEIGCAPSVIGPRRL